MWRIALFVHCHRYQELQLMTTLQLLIAMAAAVEAVAVAVAALQPVALLASAALAILTPAITL
jgi:hypothetical protein